MKRTCVALLLLIATVTGHAQLLPSGNKGTITGFDSLVFATNVSHLDEFISRFNGESYRADKPEEYHNRTDGILLLFDGARLKNHNDSAYIAARTFCEQVAKDSILLDNYSGDWYAEITCAGLLNKQEVNFKLYLSIDLHEGQFYKWVITGADGELFKTSRQKEVAGLYLSPTEHGMRFMELKTITSNRYKFIDEYTKDSYRADPLSIFLTLVRTGLLKITQVNELNYHFLDVPGYAFTVSNVRRQTLNSGWLITKLEPCDELKKLTTLYKVGK